MNERADLTTTEYLQPASAAGTISGLGAAAAGVIGSIRSGDIVLDVPDTEQWLDRFNSLIDELDHQHWDLSEAAREVAGDSSLGHFELSDQIRAKIVARLSEVPGGFAAAIKEVATGLRQVHDALRASLATHVAADQVGADGLRDIHLG